MAAARRNERHEYKTKGLAAGVQVFRQLLIQHVELA
jgi:hypothetical protein